MKVASVRILEVSGLSQDSMGRGHQVCVRVLPDNKGSYADLVGSLKMTCGTAWNFAYTNVKESSICFSLFEMEPERKELGRLTLPLRWFQINSLVTEAFPCRMLLPEHAHTPAMIKVEMHLSEDGSYPFNAPPGRLLVKPAWKKPPTQAVAQQQVQYAYPANYQYVVYPQAPYGYPPHQMYAVPQQPAQPPVPAPKPVVQPKPAERKKKNYGTYTKKDAMDQSLGVPTLDMPDEDPLGACGNQKLLETDLKPLNIGGTRPFGRADTSTAEPLIESDFM